MAPDIGETRQRRDKKAPFVVSLSNHAFRGKSGAEVVFRSIARAWFDKLTTNGIFDKPNTNGVFEALTKNGVNHSYGA